jgi:hypothetical protein
MRTATAPFLRERKPTIGENARDELAQLASEIEISHDEITTLHGRALDHAREAGKALDQAKAICRRTRRRDKSCPSWSKWVPQKLGMTRHMAQIYVRIFKNWDLVKDLEGDERSIRGAIRFLRKKAGRAVGEPKPITIKATDLLAAAERHGFKNVASPAKLEAFANEILKLAHITKTIKLGGREL